MESPERPVHEVGREQAAWQRRPFARTFDLIAAEYGWTDDQILDLTMARMRQIRDVIWERQREEQRSDLSVRGTELQILAEYIAASAGNAKGAEAARKIRLVPDDETEKPKREPKMIPYAMAKRLFGG